MAALAGWRRARPLVAALALVGALACTENKTSGTEFGPLQLNITPGAPATTLQDLQGNASIQHPADATATFVWSWKRDGVDVGNTTRSVASSGTVKHETWQVTVFADLGSSASDPVTAQFSVLNSPPTTIPAVPTITFAPMGGVCTAGNAGMIGKSCSLGIQCRFSPVGKCEPHTNSTLSTAVTTADDDGDIVSLAYQWFVNGVDVATTSTLDSSLTSVGDTVAVSVTANDGEVDSRRTSSVEIQAVPPSPFHGGGGTATAPIMSSSFASAGAAPQTPLRRVQPFREPRRWSRRPRRSTESRQGIFRARS